MTKNVLVHIKGLQGDVDNAAIEEMCTGTYYCKNKVHYVFYEEFQEGFSEVTRCQLRIREESLEIIKKGLSNMHMVLKRGEKEHTSYVSPYGRVELETKAKSLDICVADEEIRIHSAYTISSEGEWITENEIEILVREERQ